MRTNAVSSRRAERAAELTASGCAASERDAVDSEHSAGSKTSSAGNERAESHRDCE